MSSQDSFFNGGYREPWRDAPEYDDPEPVICDVCGTEIDGNDYVFTDKDGTKYCEPCFMQLLADEGYPVSDIYDGQAFVCDVADEMGYDFRQAKEVGDDC